MTTLTDSELLNPDNYKVLPFQPIPKKQALNSTTFRLPPTDGSLKIPELWDWHLDQSPDHLLFVYAEDDGTERFVYWKEAIPAAHRAGRLALNRLKPDPPPRPIFALLCATGNFAHRTRAATNI